MLMQILAMLHGAVPFFKQLIFTTDGPFFFYSPTAALLLGMLTIASCFSRLICAGFFITDSCKHYEFRPDSVENYRLFLLNNTINVVAINIFNYL